MGPFAFTSGKAIQQKAICEQESLSKALGLPSAEIHYSTSSEGDFNQRSEKDLDLWQVQDRDHLSLELSKV